MSATIKYKGETIATASNNTKTLLTAGKYMEANVVVTDNGGGGATLQTKSVSYTPSETAISDAVLPDAGYDGMDRVNVSVGAISPNYVGSEVPVRDASNISVSEYDEYVTAAAGYYPNAVTKYMTPKLKPSPVLSLNASNGRVTATATYSTSDETVGYHDSGTATGSLQLITKSARTYTPTTTDQTISSGQYLIGNQTILGDADLVASNIKKDVNIFGVTGTYEGSGATLQTKSVTIVPTETAITQSVTPSSGYDGLSQVTVNVGAISSTYVGSEIPRNDSTDVYRQSHYVGIPEGYYADDVLYDFPLASTPHGGIDNIDSSGNVDISVEIDNGGYIGSGTYTITDAVPVQVAQTITPGTTNQTITRGKWLGGDQTILGDADLVASNIKKDVTIFGVTGTYEGSGGGGTSKVLINESVITSDTAYIEVSNIAYDNILITTNGLKTGKTSSMGALMEVQGSVCGSKTSVLFNSNVFASISSHAGFCRFEDLGNGYKLGTRSESPALTDNNLTIRYVGQSSNIAAGAYQYGDITRIKISPSESGYPFTGGTVRIYGW